MEESYFWTRSFIKSNTPSWVTRGFKIVLEGGINNSTPIDIFKKNTLIFRLHFPVLIFKEYTSALPLNILWRWLLERVTEISIHFFKILIGVINSTF